MKRERGINKNMAKHIDAKILAKYVKAKYRLHPQMQEWYKAYGLLLKGYYRRIDFIEDSKGLGEKKNSNILENQRWYLNQTCISLQNSMFYKDIFSMQKI